MFEEVQGSTSHREAEAPHMSVRPVEFPHGSGYRLRRCPLTTQTKFTNIHATFRRGIEILLNWHISIGFWWGYRAIFVKKTVEMCQFTKNQNDLLKRVVYVGKLFSASDWYRTHPTELCWMSPIDSHLSMLPCMYSGISCIFYSGLHKISIYYIINW